MGWLRFDDRVRQHPKIVTAGPLAAWLWFCGICWSREHLTDGFIPHGIVPTLAAGMPQPDRRARELVEAGLWEPAQGGYHTHDFLDWNPSKAQVEESRAADRKRKRNPRGFQEERFGIPDGIQPESEPPTRARVARTRIPDPDPDLERTAPERSEGASQGERERGKHRR